MEWFLSHTQQCFSFLSSSSSSSTMWWFLSFYWLILYLSIYLSIFVYLYLISLSYFTFSLPLSVCLCCCLYSFTLFIRSLLIAATHEEATETGLISKPWLNGSVRFEPNPGPLLLISYKSNWSQWFSLLPQMPLGPDKTMGLVHGINLH